MGTETQVICPFCGEEITIIVDCSEEEQTYTEDCSVCCKPILIRAMCSEDEILSIEAKRES